MTVNIEQIVLHQLIKQSDQLNIVLRDSVLKNDSAVDAMVSELHRVYSAKNKAFGLFDQNSPFAELLHNYSQGNVDFLTFTKVATQRLRDELAKYPFAEGGVVVFCQYRHLATKYLLIAVLDSCDSMWVNDQLDVSMTHYLDIEHADIVARIDLTEWQTNPQSTRYLTFLKGRIGRKVSDFFMDFLAATEGLDTKAQNKGLLQAVDDYCCEAQLEKQERQSCRKQVYSYCNGQLQAGEEISLSELAKELPVLGDRDFNQFTHDKGYELEQQFPADRSTLRQLTKFSGSGGGVTISFDTSLLGERIFWDAQTDTLTIKGTPPNLRDQLQRYKDE